MKRRAIGGLVAALLLWPTIGWSADKPLEPRPQCEPPAGWRQWCMHWRVDGCHCGLRFTVQPVPPEVQKTATVIRPTITTTANRLKP
jgi:hypothetical protein